MRNVQRKRESDRKSPNENNVNTVQIERKVRTRRVHNTHSHPQTKKSPTKSKASMQILLKRRGKKIQFSQNAQFMYIKIQQSIHGRTERNITPLLLLIAPAISCYYEENERV